MSQTWRCACIIENITDLSDNTLCSSKLLDFLQKEKILDKNEAQAITYEKTEYDRASKLYQLLPTKTFGLEKMVEALEVTNQGVANDILMKGLEKHAPLNVLVFFRENFLGRLNLQNLRFSAENNNQDSSNKTTFAILFAIAIAIIAIEHRYNLFDNGFNNLLSKGKEEVNSASIEFSTNQESVPLQDAVEDLKIKQQIEDLKREKISIAERLLAQAQIDFEVAKAQVAFIEGHRSSYQKQISKIKERKRSMGTVTLAWAIEEVEFTEALNKANADLQQKLKRYEEAMAQLNRARNQ